MSELTPEEVFGASLAALFESDERWTPNGPNVSRLWEDSTVDTLILFSPATTYAVREMPDGRRPWAMGPAPAELILYHAKRLLSPDHPNAPEAHDSDLPEAEWWG
jgi:hypothetical protein